MVLYLKEASLVINTRLYLLKRRRRGDALHEDKEDLLVVILACWSIISVVRVFIVYLPRVLENLKNCTSL